MGQSSANDLNANTKYPTLDGRIEATYAKRSTARSQRTLYDSYIRAFRWATDRIGDAGVVVFVSNGGWIDGNTADGMRLSLADEYSHLYVYNLRGNMRNADWRNEGGQIFGGGSQATVAIFIGIKNPSMIDICKLHYAHTANGLTREQKLESIRSADIERLDWQQLTPNLHGDWINQRDESFSTWPVLGRKKGDADGLAIFAKYSLGLATGRDAWCYNASAVRLADQVRTMIETYEKARADFEAEVPSTRTEAAVEDFLNNHPDAMRRDRISWNRNAKNDLARNRSYEFHPGAITTAIYRPFFKQNCYFHRDMNAMLYQLPSMFPTSHHSNAGFCLMGGGTSLVSPLMVNALPDLNFFGFGGQFFPRWTQEKVDESGTLDFSGRDDVDQWGYRRVDNITDDILSLYQSAIGGQVTKDDIFYYVYGVLHDPDYRTRYAADLKKMLPHIPTPETAERFHHVAGIGRQLADLHVNYEAAEPYPLDVELKPGADPANRETWRVDKMKWRSKTDKSAIIYNGAVTIAGIPDAAHDYMLGSRSALEWIIDRYQVKTDKASGIVNDPNDWCDEHDDPTYIVDLIKKVTTVSVRTVELVAQLSQ